MKTMLGFLRRVNGSANRPAQGFSGLVLMSLARPR